MKKLFTTYIFSALWIMSSAGDEFCGVRNTAFKHGETITLNVFYSVVGIYVNAGTAVVTTSLKKLDNKTVYHVVGDGKSNSRYDWIFRVRDRYESYFDTTHLLPYKFIRNVDEGGYKKKENVIFNQQNKTAISTTGVIKIPRCVQDVLSAVYYARNLNFNKYRPGDKIPFSMYLDDEVHNIYVRYMGKEVVKTRYGKFHAIKIKPLLIKGTMFEGGEKMTVWVSDDANRIPLRIESQIVVGSIKVDAMHWRNLRHPLTSKISTR